MTGPVEPAPFAIADERRATILAMNAWMAARGDRELPDLTILFDGSRRLGDSEFLIKIDEATLAPVFMVCGNEIDLPLTTPGIGNPVTRAMAPDLGDMIREACAEAVRGGDAVFREATAATAPEATVSYRCNFMAVRSGLDESSMYVFGAYGSRALPATERTAA